MAILYFFIHLGPTMLHKKFQVILIRNDGMMAFFVISHFHNIYVWVYYVIVTFVRWSLMCLNDYPLGLGSLKAKPLSLYYIVLHYIVM